MVINNNRIYRISYYFRLLKIFQSFNSIFVHVALSSVYGCYPNIVSNPMNKCLAPNRLYPNDQKDYDHGPDIFFYFSLKITII